MEIVTYLNSIFWGWLVARILLSCGIFYTLRLGFPQIRYFTKLIHNLQTASVNNKGVSAFGALCSAIGSEVGAGSLVGVATALASGGPGAIFWMWVTAILGMPIMFGEAVLAQLFRVKNADGTTYRGGPAYYISRGMNNKVLALLFSIAVIAGNGVVYCMIQSNSIVGSFSNVTTVPPLVLGSILVFLVGIVIFGGIKRLSTVASYIVPFMAFAYIILALIVLLTHIDFLWDMVTLIIDSAFGIQQAAGGVLGYSVQEAFRYGVARGLFSNDAGAGTTPSMHASANVRHPVNQGLSGMLGVFVTTIIVCSCTAFCILLSGQLGSGLTGIQLTQASFAASFGSLGYWIVAMAMFLFGYTTLLANMYYGEVNMRYIFKNNTQVVNVYRVFALCLILCGSVVPVVEMWELADLFGAFMVFFNVIGLFCLSKYVLFALKDYEKKRKNVPYPVWDYSADVVELYRKEKAEQNKNEK